MNPDNGFSASFIPIAFFRTVTGTVVDEEGEPITEATWIFARSGFPTLRPVDENGKFSLQLLKTDYAYFGLIVESGREDVEYSWIMAVDTVVSSTDKEAELVFSRKELKGMWGGAGATFGGPLTGCCKVDHDPPRNRHRTRQRARTWFLGYIGRDWTPQDGFEEFVLAKLIRTVVIYGAAGALVGLAGEPLTEGNIVTATGATVLLGEVAERLVTRVQRELERREFPEFGVEAGG